jgi:hypothetical protein
MQNFEVVQSGQPFDNLQKNIPDLLLFELIAFFLILEDFLQKITSVSILHNNAR